MRKFLLGLMVVAAVLSHKCIHDQIVDRHPVDEIPMDSQRMMSVGEYRPLRIKVMWGEMEGATEAQKEYSKDVMIPYSLDYISKVLNVNSRPNLDISHLRTRMERLKGLGIDYQPKCGTYVIPKEMIENPIDYDFVMFVNVGFDKENANTLAYAAPCLKDLNHNGRPVMGYSYYNTKNMNLVMDEFQENVETAIHEFLHAFGFSGSMAQHFLDENGRPRGDSVIKKVVKRGMPTSIIDLPKLTKFAREYFDCPDIEGVEMENQGGSGSLGSHFEHRMVRDDLMNSHDDYNRQFTEFLAILLEETHWYRVNRKYVGQSITGYKAGCRYIDEKCVSSYDSSSKTATVVNNLDFCSKLGKEGMCNTQYTHGSYCGTQSFDKYTGIEKAFDYFDGLMMTRGSSNGDNCPLKNGFEGDNCVDGTRTNRYSSYFEQSFGDDSRCVTGSYMKSGYRPYQMQRCAKASCHEDGNEVTFDLGSAGKVICDGSQDKVPVSGNGYSGNLDCPDSIERFCISLNQEYFNNPKRFPYEDRKESTTVSDEQNGKSSYANRVARNKKKNGGRFDVMKLSKVYIEQLKNVYSNFGDFAKSIFESLDTAIYAAGLYGTDEDLKKYMFESLSKFFNFGQSASDRLKVAIANTVSAVPRVKEGTSSSSDDSNSATQKPKETIPQDSKPKMTDEELTEELQEAVRNEASKYFKLPNWFMKKLDKFVADAVAQEGSEASDEQLFDAIFANYKKVFGYWSESMHESFEMVFKAAVREVEQE